MTKRVPVATIRNYWHDAQRVDVKDMNVEQTSYLSNEAAIVNNHLGSGIVPFSATQTILFDSDELTTEQASLLAAGNFDGTGLQAHTQPSDTTLGNLLAVELLDSAVFGRFSVKVLIVGLDFNSEPQYERFTFHRNEIQVGRKHFTRILGIFFNDFKGNNNCSRDFGGTITIKEAASYQLSRDSLMIAQDVEPNLFFRDFKVPNQLVTLFNTLQTGIGSEYSVDSLNINTTVKITRSISASDVTTKIGEKFLAYTNNIQKLTVLMGAGRDDSAAVENRYDWTGDIVISIYELQTTVNCPTDLVPGLAIDFEPNPVPLAQLSYSQAELKDLGYILTDTLQPIDFVFSDTKLGSVTNSVIVPGKYYAFTINRAGAAGTGSIQIGVGNNRTDYCRETLYNGSWVDVEENDLWFQIWTDAAKIADGQAYDAGNGIQIEKTETNELGAEVDYILGNQSFTTTGESTINIGVVQAVAETSVEEQDERTGNPVKSRQKFEPTFSFVTESELTALQAVSEPLVIGCIEDNNPKSNTLLEKNQTIIGLVKDDTFIVVNPDADLLSLRLVGSKLIPNLTCASKDYRIFKTILCTDGYGDVNGDGYIDAADVARATELVGEGLSSASTQQKIVDGYIDTLELLRADVDGDGYITSTDVQLITDFITRQVNGFPAGSSFTHLSIQVQQSIGRWDGYFDCDGYVRLDGYSGLNIVTPESLSAYELMYDGYLSAVSMDGDDSTFTTVPFLGTTYQIKPQPFWQDYLVSVNSDARLMPASFTYSAGVTQYDCNPARLFSCEDRTTLTPEFDPGRNDIYFPDNIILGRGEILRPDGSFYPVDIEVGHIILNLPAVPLEESLIDIMGKFVVDAGSGQTRSGYPAMKFADCSTVQADALARNQVRFGVSVQAFAPNLDGYDEDGYGLIVDDIIGVYMDHANGILTLTIKDLDVDPIYKTLVTKIQITVYLKKAGWKNQVLNVDDTEIVGLLSA